MGSYVLQNTSFQHITPLGVKMPKLVCEIRRHGITTGIHFSINMPSYQHKMPTIYKHDTFSQLLHICNGNLHNWKDVFILKPDTDSVSIWPMFGYPTKPGHILDKHAAYICEVDVRNDILPGVRFRINILLFLKLIETAWRTYASVN